MPLAVSEILGLYYEKATMYYMWSKYVQGPLRTLLVQQYGPDREGFYSEIFNSVQGKRGSIDQCMNNSNGERLIRTISFQ